jgi:mono/diheme cytochrome c family protein
MRKKAGIKGDVHLKKFFLTLLLSTFLTPPAVAENSFREARKLVNSQGCKACHQLDKEGGTYAQPLEKIGSHRTREQMRQLLLNGTAPNHDRYMPSYSHLRETETKALIDYLESYQ